MEIEPIADANEFERRLHHPQGRVAVGEEHALRQGAVIDANAQRLVLAFEQTHQRFERINDAITDLGQLGLGKTGAIGIGFVKHKQARIDAHLVNVVGHLQGDLHAVVVHIGH